MVSSTFTLESIRLLFGTLTGANVVPIEHPVSFALIGADLLPIAAHQQEPVVVQPFLWPISFQRRFRGRKVGFWLSTRLVPRRTLKFIVETVQSHSKFFVLDQQAVKLRLQGSYVPSYTSIHLLTQFLFDLFEFYLGNGHEWHWSRKKLYSEEGNCPRVLHIEEKQQKMVNYYYYY